MNYPQSDKFITRKYPFWKDRVLPKIALFFYGIPKNSFGSVDVTDKCNLRCKHCYFFADPPKGKEMEVKDILAKISELTKAKGKVWNCTWVGGEPLLRQEIIERMKGFFKFNKVVTNGTLPLPDWDNVTFYVSLDGTRDIHDKIRGKGSFDKLKKNVVNPNNFGKSIRLACCVNKLNAGCIEDMLEEWYSCPNVKEMIFDFMTPIKGMSDDLWLSFEKRDQIIDKIIELRQKKYGRFIAGNDRTYKLMKSENCHLAIGENCAFMKKGFSLNAYGEFKSKCMLGPNADCKRCGCVVPFYLKSVERINIIKDLFK